LGLKIKKESIFCDIDNTVLDQYAEISKHYNFENKFFDKISFHSRDLMQDKPIDGAQEAICKLSKKFDIIWLSARDKNLRDTTEKWLKKHHFFIKDIILVAKHENKIEVLRKNSPRMFIDDLRYNYDNLNPQLMTNMINQLKINKINYIIFNNNWPAIVDKLLQKVN
jgi:uncharacterized HAD superfamily protein